MLSGLLFKTDRCASFTALARPPRYDSSILRATLLIQGCSWATVQPSGKENRLVSTDLLNLPFPMVALVVSLFGALVGSFLNVLIHRLPDEASIVWPGSRCVACEAPIAWYDNLPVLSYLMLRGHCRACGVPISWRYPLVEVLNSVLWVAFVWATGGRVTPHIMAQLVFISLLVTICWIDLETMLILDVLTFPGTLAGLVLAGTSGRLVPAVVGAIAGYAFFRVLEAVSVWWLGRPGVGRGDAKLAMLLGAWVFPQGLMVSLMTAFLSGALLGIALYFFSGRKLVQLSFPWARSIHWRERTSQPYPFGPALVFGGFLALFAGQDLWAWYLRMIGIGV